MIGKSLFIGELTEWTALDPEKDAAAISNWTANLHFSSQFFQKPARPYAAHEVKKFGKEQLKEADQKKNEFVFAVRKKGTKEMVGLLFFAWLQFSQQSARLFLDFESDESLDIYGEEVLGMALRYGFMEMSLHRIWLMLSGHQEKEIALLEAAGFLRENQRREASFHDGRFMTAWVMHF
ncbi:N-acetyltransferase [bacterium]|nr:N-acetyltransferase [bacterium]